MLCDALMCLAVFVVSLISKIHFQVADLIAKTISCNFSTLPKVPGRKRVKQRLSAQKYGALHFSAGNEKKTNLNTYRCNSTPSPPKRYNNVVWLVIDSSHTTPRKNKIGARRPEQKSHFKQQLNHKRKLSLVYCHVYLGKVESVCCVLTQITTIKMEVLAREKLWSSCTLPDLFKKISLIESLK